VGEESVHVVGRGGHTAKYLIRMPQAIDRFIKWITRYFNPPREDVDSGNVGLDARLDVLCSLRDADEIRDTRVAERVLEATLKITEITRESVFRIEGKATSVIVLSTALLGFTMSFLGSAHNIVVPLLWLECFLLVGAIVTSALVLLVGAVPIPTPVLYNLATTLDDPANEGKIVMQLIESWHIYGVSERLIGLRKSRVFRVSFVATILALCVLAVVVGLSAAGSGSAHTPAATPTAGGKAVAGKPGHTPNARPNARVTCHAPMTKLAYTVKSVLK